MAGMFYSLKEAAEKLGKTEEEVKRLSREGKLREFRDGSNVMFKITEVEALIEDEMPIPFDEGTQEDITIEPETEPLPDLDVPDESEPEPAIDDMELAAELDEPLDLEPVEEPEEVAKGPLDIEQEPDDALEPEPAVEEMEHPAELDALDLEPAEEPEEVSEESLGIDQELDDALEPEPTIEDTESIPELDALDLEPAEEPKEVSEESLSIDQELDDALEPEPTIEDTESIPDLEPAEELQEAPEEPLLLEQDSDTQGPVSLEDVPEIQEPESSEDLDQLLDLESSGSLEASEITEPEDELDLDSEPESLMPDTDVAVPEEPQGEHVESSDTQVISSEQITEPKESLEDEEISLVSETESTAEEKELTDIDTALIDTALTGEGITVLGETDEYKLTDDTMAETMAAFGGTGEASLEEIEEDVNLDSFGSGSGLLDLSLQADDTSLGGILDEIYTTEGQEGAAPEGVGMTEDMVAEADQLPIDNMGAEAFGETAPVMTSVFTEAAPDAESNTFGAILFIPLGILIYTTIVVWAAVMGVAPFILTSIQGLIWILMGGACVASMVVAGVAYTKGSDRPAKPKKIKEKKPKPKKEKKKKEKKPKRGKKKEESEE